MESEKISMMDVVNKIMEMKAERYSFQPENYEGARELMVTITLCEYRDLIEQGVRYNCRYNEEVQKRQRAEDELAKVKAECEKLKRELDSKTEKEE